MAMETQRTEADQALALAQHRGYMTLPPEERRQCLAAQAGRMTEGVAK
jgi:hypothetical protein